MLPRSHFFHSIRFKSSSSPKPATRIHPIQLDHQSLINSQHAQASAKSLIDQLLAHHPKFKETLEPFAKLNFSTSGGKGGQNVNKVNTKATLKLELGKLNSIIPAYWITNLSNSHLYAPQTGQLVIHSSLTRSQPSNVDDCWTKLHHIFKSASEAGLIGETSVEQAEKVKRLKSIDKSRTKKLKSIRKDIKANRSKPIF
ncbi:hypothetical protein PTTG_28892 [Puccinia triticina 1-1 BBBD Race 1]|uniref:RF_PROK_I domain-containing protein n=2 Tax=Puccinia triticina TaxID=208348 RepID=A0A180G8D8_PUCT1|nr:uncharacterized protein PtA15_7A522 [Puccinia triticina]OAV88874.1 hypothetical protein PTTG_28892 [Puccinia triticina 1-1 BBBD Race 1]WAQ86793.1 hypothetical protein PtA15_7A522 [Puccinia triticina]WAR56662.1 hypothetical protein PtB15_7B512 [Puccinia triticina]